jgi:hypothetical protein
MTYDVTLRRWGLGIILHIARVRTRYEYTGLFTCDQSGVSNLPTAHRANLIGGQ